MRLTRRVTSLYGRGRGATPELKSRPRIGRLLVDWLAGEDAGCACPEQIVPRGLGTQEPSKNWTALGRSGLPARTPAAPVRQQIVPRGLGTQEPSKNWTALGRSACRRGRRLRLFAADRPSRTRDSRAVQELDGSWSIGQPARTPAAPVRQQIVPRGLGTQEPSKNWTALGRSACRRGRRLRLSQQIVPRGLGTQLRASFLIVPCAR